MATDIPANCEDCPSFLGVNNCSDNNLRLELFNWSGEKSEDSYDCPATPDFAKRLAKNAHDSHSLICLADFINANGLDGALYSFAPPDSGDEKTASTSPGLGESASSFPGKVFSRGEAYQHIIADKKAAPDLKAYALYRLIKCYSPSQYNHCGGQDVEVSVRKSWFHTLKKRYAGSSWAKDLKYYW
ncbi:MAG: hypothetical protein ACTFAL_02600 [Candidatus Electronema sp. V4]|uniref:hypothetical protein n=1 Tax=Candidatus Electronema sp. V4 TaxID=3454756 RepID=UPI004055912B